MNEKEVTNLNGTATEDGVVDGPQQAKPEGVEREGPAAATGAAGVVAADAGDGAGAGGALSAEDVVMVAFTMAGLSRLVAAYNRSYVVLENGQRESLSFVESGAGKATLVSTLSAVERQTFSKRTAPKRGKR